MTISGASDQLDATKAALATNYPVALVIVFLLLVAILLAPILATLASWIPAVMAAQQDPATILSQD